MALVCEAKNLSYSYIVGKKRLEVLRGLDFSLEAGTCAALMGASGSGKSTLLHLMGLLDRPQKGELWFLEKNVTRMSEGRQTQLRRNNIGLVYQAHYLLPELVAYENVMMPLLLQKASLDQAAREAKRLLKQMGLQHRLYHHPSQLSGGEAQRVAIVRSLIHKPALLLADEPTGSLDEKNSESVMDMMLELVREAGTTLLMATHNPSLASLCQRTLYLKDGVLVDR